MATPFQNLPLTRMDLSYNLCFASEQRLHHLATNILRHNPSLTELHLSNCNITSSGVKCLCDALLKYSKTLKSLHLENNRICDVGAAELVGVLGSLDGLADTSLKKLYLDGNQITDTGALGLLQKKRLGILEELSLERNQLSSLCGTNELGRRRIVSRTKSRKNQSPTNAAIPTTSTTNASFSPKSTAPKPSSPENSDTNLLRSLSALSDDSQFDSDADKLLQTFDEWQKQLSTASQSKQPESKESQSDDLSQVYASLWNSFCKTYSFDTPDLNASLHKMDSLYPVLEKSLKLVKCSEKFAQWKQSEQRAIQSVVDLKPLVRDKQNTEREIKKAQLKLQLAELEDDTESKDKIDTQLKELLKRLSTVQLEIEKTYAELKTMQHHAQLSEAEEIISGAVTMHDTTASSSTAAGPLMGLLTELLLHEEEYQPTSDTEQDSALEMSVYDKLESLITSAEGEEYEYLKKNIIPRLLKKLEETTTTDDPTQKVKDLQSRICGMLQCCTETLGRDSQIFAEVAMRLYLKLFTSSPAVSSDVMLAIEALVVALEQDFIRYMDSFMPFFLKSLASSQSELCEVSLATLGDLCAGIGTKIMPYCERIMKTLLTELHKDDTVNSSRPNMLLAFADIALCIGERFQRYIPPVAEVLYKTSQYEVDQRDENQVAYQNELRQSILETYTGLVQGLKKHFEQHLDPVFEFLKIIREDPVRNQDVLRAAVALIGDLANVYGTTLKNRLNSAYISYMIEAARRSDDLDLRKTAEWAYEEIYNH